MASIKVCGFNSTFFSVFFMVFLLSSCGQKHGASEVPFLFSGECSVEIVSKTKDAEILLDGIHLGEGHVKASVPCGEKKVLVKKHGYVTYAQYLPVSIKFPLKVTVELKKELSEKIYALSDELVAYAKNPPKTGKKLPGGVVSADAAMTPSAGSAPAPAKTYNSVEDWR